MVRTPADSSADSVKVAAESSWRILFFTECLVSTYQHVGEGEGIAAGGLERLFV